MLDVEVGDELAVQYCDGWHWGAYHIERVARVLPTRAVTVEGHAFNRQTGREVGRNPRACLEAQVVTPKIRAEMEEQQQIATRRSDFDALRRRLDNLVRQDVWMLRVSDEALEALKAAMQRVWEEADANSR